MSSSARTDSFSRNFFTLNECFDKKAYFRKKRKWTTSNPFYCRATSLRRPSRARLGTRARPFIAVSRVSARKARAAAPKQTAVRRRRIGPNFLGVRVVRRTVNTIRTTRQSRIPVAVEQQKSAFLGVARGKTPSGRDSFCPFRRRNVYLPRVS